MRDYIRLGGVLFIITAVVAFILAAGNSLTKDKIAALTSEAKAAAQQEVLKKAGTIIVESAAELDVNAGTTVTAITKFKTAGGKEAFAVACSPKGYGGDISMMVGVDEDLKVTGISIIDNGKETPGLGARVGEPQFYEQYIGKTKDIKITKSKPSGNEVEAVTGATISSRAVTSGVNDALKLVGEALGR